MDSSTTHAKAEKPGAGAFVDCLRYETTVTLINLLFALLEVSMHISDKLIIFRIGDSQTLAAGENDGGVLLLCRSKRHIFLNFLIVVL